MNSLKFLLLLLTIISGVSKTNAQTEETPAITGYYWRDFHGVIPKDALSISEPSQKTKAYLGWAYDPSLNGTFVTTIFGGKNFVHTTRDGKKNEVTKNIQILCTQEPKRMNWVHLNPNGTEKVEGVIYIQSGVKLVKDSYPQITYAARVVKDYLTYAGDTAKRQNPVSYVDIDGNITTDEYFEFLYYNKTGDLDKESLNGEDQVGTNGGPDISLDYYWLGSQTFSNSTAMITGKIYGGKDVYSCQTFDITANVFAIGYSETPQYCYVVKEKEISGNIADIRIFGTLTPEKFEWIETNSTEVLKMDRTYFIGGGQLPNGTEIFIGRRKNEKDGTYYTSSITLYDDKAYSFDFYESFGEKFEILSHVKS